ncbi:coiled-coil domain-containing protein 90B, mitochondrial-like isoform X2 [Leptonychotes weddellii]|uniref:Coiled-coil domain-containing protein 90B, mitochondrial-like isoform X2 n=1 Tax=Leptonychotes weddellii TaxID=9713 RepID=A0A7F8QXG8_LEPWE|nr:coiled-coil domain-containing protein 90B, mitochondrial-like isoform X2 [Leptonychotes weddellii]
MSHPVPTVLCAILLIASFHAHSKIAVVDRPSVRLLLSSQCLSQDFFTTTTKEGYDMRRVDITPLEQRRLTFDTHALVQDLETHGFDKAQAETIVSALTTLSNVSLDSIYKEMVTRAQQVIFSLLSVLTVSSVFFILHL